MKNTPILNTLVFALVILVNALANILPINGFQTGELSAMYPNYFVPAGFTFSIWGVIYLLLLVWTGYFLYPYKDKQVEYYKTFLRYWFVASCVLNIGWILAWHFLFVKLSLVVMLGLLYSLIKIYQTLYEQKRHWIVKLPFSVYLGWISVATIANMTAVLVSMGIDGGELAPHLSAVMIAVAGILAVLMLLRKGDAIFSAVLLWAMFGIQYKYDQVVIDFTVYISAAAIFITMAYTWIKKRVYFVHG